MFLTAAAWAQNSPGTIVATGTERVRVQPKAIRLVCEVRAEGKTAEEAVRNLQGQRETMSARLKELGADGDSIDFTPAALEQGCLTPYYPFIAPETTSSPSDNESGYVPSPPAQSSNPFAPSPPAPPAAPAGIPPAGTTPDALPTPGRDESSQYTPGRPAPAPSLSSTSAGRRTYAPGPATLPPPATSVAPATGYGVSSLAQAAPVVGPYPRAANPPAVTIMPAASATSSSGDPEPTLVPAPTPPPAGAYLVPGPAPLGAVQQADPPRIPGASGGSESQAALGLNQPVGGGRVPGMSGGSEGQPGWGPSQPMPSPMDNARRASFVARTTLTA
jgi:hypothetical protein